MDVTIRESAVAGTTQAPPSKSYTHRAILAAGYAEGATVHDPLVSADTKATMRAVTAYGGTVDRSDESAIAVEGFDGRPETPDDVIDCANSGTTMRLVTATAALQDDLTVLTGDDSLRSRPQGPLLDAIGQLGGRADSTRANGQAPLVVGGGVDGGTVAIPGDVSSQYITALLMAGAVTDTGIDVELTTELKSSPYVDITLEVLSDFGVTAEQTDDGYTVAGGQSYGPEDGTYHVPGDFSSMSYLLAMGALAGDDAVAVTSAFPSAQGDSAIVDVLDRMGATLDWDQQNGEITVERSALSGIEVGVEDTPDLLPTIATLGAAADGVTRITDAEHVRYKETDRVSAMAEELTKMGAEVEETQDELVVYGEDTDLHGATVDGRADHRIIMSLAVAGLVADGETTVTGAEHVDVSFPNFFDVLSGLGAAVDR
ncbi:MULTISPECIES: 3-phosphoshikimate 1-carboxyvinyltransferase [Haloarcula]|uniref:3-phosphoshikimate 1-carboxyvinyltransferase n=1 Tax=Haloarcula pellucida TaxID=1427151 RepID=A0A830GIB5_9EURY|nr:MULTISPECIES: 3-phosphoshikimate 1-carboxyvinyltransferase [Halomicroarcula]MBX0347771.1 3-phosphoshikimate 1-carboxyvinyltransferase [Halomicroarcula pellucida]MDS0276296.1 3-phosphoshikimate 1-carboxyvinyltransferase [Halomicroarcula sp. S1AR25-4]GGN90216.1 3-phosphoshikimate 1-carboxyvinyltransferase [Halomicroarcula pellucida]